MAKAVFSSVLFHFLMYLSPSMAF